MIGLCRLLNVNSSAEAVNIVAVPYSYTIPNMYISNDFGGIFTIKTIITGATLTNLIFGIYNYGNKIMINRTGGGSDTGQYSINGGANFTTIPLTARSRPGAPVISYDGNVFAEMHGIYVNISTNSGTSWVQRSTSSPSNLSDIAINNNGNLIAAVSASIAYVRYSTNYGANWSTTGTVFSTGMYEIAMSYDNRMYVGAYNSGDTIAISTNSGTTWTKKLVGPNQTGVRSVRVRCNKTGQYVIMGSGPQVNYVSNDYGNNWTRILTQYSGATLGPSLFNSKAISDSGKYMVMGSNQTNGLFHYSDDYGVTWQDKYITTDGSTPIGNIFYAIGVNN